MPCTAIRQLRSLVLWLDRRTMSQPEKVQFEIHAFICSFALTHRLPMQPHQQPIWQQSIHPTISIEHPTQCDRQWKHTASYALSICYSIFVWVARKRKSPPKVTIWARMFRCRTAASQRALQTVRVPTVNLVKPNHSANWTRRKPISRQIKTRSKAIRWTIQRPHHRRPTVNTPINSTRTVFRRRSIRWPTMDRFESNQMP